MKSRPKETRVPTDEHRIFRCFGLALVLAVLFAGCKSKWQERAERRELRKHPEAAYYDLHLPGPNDKTAIINLVANHYGLKPGSLVNLLKRNPKRIRNFCQLHAIHRLGHLKVMESIPLILGHYASSQDNWLRLEAAFALARMGHWPSDSILVQVRSQDEDLTHLYNIISYALFLNDYRGYPILDSLLSTGDSLSLFDLDGQYRLVADYAAHYGKPDTHGLYVNALPAFQERYRKGDFYQIGLLRYLMHSTPPLPAELLAIVGEGRDTITDENLRWHVDSVLRMR